MVANLSAHKRGWDDRWEVPVQRARFDAIMVAYGMPKEPDDQKAKRHQAIPKTRLLPMRLESMRTPTAPGFDAIMSIGLWHARKLVKKSTEESEILKLVDSVISG